MVVPACPTCGHEMDGAAKACGACGTAGAQSTADAARVDAPLSSDPWPSPAPPPAPELQAVMQPPPVAGPQDPWNMTEDPSAAGPDHAPKDAVYGERRPPGPRDPVATVGLVFASAGLYLLYWWRAAFAEVDEDAGLRPDGRGLARFAALFFAGLVVAATLPRYAPNLFVALLVWLPANAALVLYLRREMANLNRAFAAAGLPHRVQPGAALAAQAGLPLFPVGLTVSLLLPGLVGAWPDGFAANVLVLMLLWAMAGAVAAVLAAPSLVYVQSRINMYWAVRNPSGTPLPSSVAS